MSTRGRGCERRLVAARPRRFTRAAALTALTTRPSFERLAPDFVPDLPALDALVDARVALDTFDDLEAFEALDTRLATLPGPVAWLSVATRGSRVRFLAARSVASLDARWAARALRGLTLRRLVDGWNDLERPTRLFAAADRVPEGLPVAALPEARRLAGLVVVVVLVVAVRRLDAAFVTSCCWPRLVADESLSTDTKASTPSFRSSVSLCPAALVAGVAPTSLVPLPRPAGWALGSVTRVDTVSARVPAIDGLRTSLGDDDRASSRCTPAAGVASRTGTCTRGRDTCVAVALAAVGADERLADARDDDDRDRWSATDRAATACRGERAGDDARTVVVCGCVASVGDTMTAMAAPAAAYAADRATRAGAVAGGATAQRTAIAGDAARGSTLTRPATSARGEVTRRTGDAGPWRGANGRARASTVGGRNAGTSRAVDAAAAWMYCADAAAGAALGTMRWACAAVDVTTGGLQDGDSIGCASAVTPSSLAPPTTLAPVWTPMEGPWLRGGVAVATLGRRDVCSTPAVRDEGAVRAATSRSSLGSPAEAGAVAFMLCGPDTVGAAPVAVVTRELPSACDTDGAPACALRVAIVTAGTGAALAVGGKKYTSSPARTRRPPLSGKMATTGTADAVAGTAAAGVGPEAREASTAPSAAPLDAALAAPRRGRGPAVVAVAVPLGDATRGDAADAANNARCCSSNSGLVNRLAAAAWARARASVRGDELRLRLRLRLRPRARSARGELSEEDKRVTWPRQLLRGDGVSSERMAYPSAATSDGGGHVGLWLRLR